MVLSITRSISNFIYRLSLSLRNSVPHKIVRECLFFQRPSLFMKPRELQNRVLHLMKEAEEKRIRSMAKQAIESFQNKT